MLCDSVDITTIRPQDVQKCHSMGKPKVYHGHSGVPLLFLHRAGSYRDNLIACSFTFNKVRMNDCLN